MKRIVYAFSIITGTIIGAGLFALPYLTLKTDPWIMIGYFLILGSVAILVHYFFAKAALKTPNQIRLPGFAKYHLGQDAYKIASLSAILGVFGTNLAYLILGGKFLSAILGQSETVCTLIYAAVGALLILIGVKAIDKTQLAGLVLIVISLIAILFRGFNQIDFTGLVFESNSSFFFLPYGVVLFSLWGLSLIPEAEEILKDRVDLLPKITSFAIIFSIIIYSIFIFLILGLSGNQTPPDAVSFLNQSLGQEVTILVLVLAILTTFTSFIALGLTIKKTLTFDLKINEKLSWAITTIFPIGLYLIGINDFIRVISMVGGTMLVIDGIIVSLIYKKLYPSRLSSLVYPVIVALILGLIYEVVNFFL